MKDVSVTDLIDFLGIDCTRFDVRGEGRVQLRFSCDFYKAGKLVGSRPAGGLTLDLPDHLTVFTKETARGLVLHFYSKGRRMTTRTFAELMQVGDGLGRGKCSVSEFTVDYGARREFFALYVPGMGALDPDGRSSQMDDAKNSAAALVLCVEARLLEE